MKKFMSVFTALAVVASALPFAAFPAFAADVNTITGDAVISGTADMTDITSDAVVTLDGAAIRGEGRSAIFVRDGANVTFRLEGESVITGDADAFSCGIEVEYGSSVTFEGDGTLNVTGGKWGAAIGSYGTTINIPAEQRRNVGEITINSGNIIATAGARGAGIGAGYHVNGNKITINGGTVHAYGKECGAGIGCGYGTSGGAIGVAAVGEYDSGSVIINGGTIYATSVNVGDIDNYSYNDLTALNAGYDSFAAGIGGGYGASASDIQINGGKILAIGGCGGAGIGAGRGCSKATKYNADAYRANIRIGGDAEVTAVTASSRANEFNGGGAAIGAGRGTHTGGNIEITGNAKVTAISASQSPAIGASTQKSPVDGTIPHAESIVIGNDVTLYAVSMGTYAVDKGAVYLDISEDYFGSSDRWFFGEDAVAISDISNVKAESPKGEQTYSVPVGSVSLWANIVPPTPPQPEVKKANLKIITPLAMAVRFGDGSVYYSGDTAEVELDKEYTFQMCCVDWSTRDDNGEKKKHYPYETFYETEMWNHTNHGTYSDDGLGLCGTVVYRFTLSADYKTQSFDADTKTFSIPKTDAVLRTDTNKCFMAYRFHFASGDYNKQTGIDNVIYDTGREHENTLEDFRYNKPLESLSVNLPLGSTIIAKAYKNYELLGEAEVYVKIDEENPDLSWTDYTWNY